MIYLSILFLCFSIYFTQDTPRRVDAIPSFGSSIDKSSTHGAFCVMDTTIWKDIPGYEGLYEASDTGLIRSLRRFWADRDNNLLSNKILRPKFDKDCYLSLGLMDSNNEVKTKRVSLLVALVFVPNPENKPIVDHINGVRWDNRAANLRWVTQSENLQASYDMGRKVKAGKTIDQFDSKGNLIKRYRVMRDVEKDGYSSKAVNRVVLGQRNHYKGYLWKVAEIEHEIKVT